MDPVEFLRFDFGISPSSVGSVAEAVSFVDSAERRRCRLTAINRFCAIVLDKGVDCEEAVKQLSVCVGWENAERVTKGVPPMSPDEEARFRSVCKAVARRVYFNTYED